MYHNELYIGWTMNEYYAVKIVGKPILPLEKFIFGVLIATGILFLLIGPFILFSTVSPLVSFNPVLGGVISLNM